MDCPDWLLAQIAASSKLSAIKYRGLCQLAIDYSIRNELSDDALLKYKTDDVDLRDLHRIISSLAFVINRAAGYNCAPEDLEAELIQLGLPPEHSKMLHRVFLNSRESIGNHLQESILKEPALEVFQMENGKNVVNMSYSKGNETTECSIPSQTFRVLLEEMKKVDEIINQHFST